MGALRKHRGMTLAEFLAWEELQEQRHEFIHGAIVAMVGGTVAHNQIVGNIDRALARLLRGSPCRVFRESLKIIADESVFYPDVFVTCTRLNDQDRLAAEPTVIVEVLSDSTASHDQTIKNSASRTLPSVAQYILVHQWAAIVESFRRDGASWLHDLVTGEDGVVSLPSLGLELPLTVVYEDTDVAYDLKTLKSGENDR